MRKCNFVSSSYFRFRFRLSLLSAETFASRMSPFGPSLFGNLRYRLGKTLRESRQHMMKKHFKYYQLWSFQWYPIYSSTSKFILLKISNLGDQSKKLWFHFVVLLKGLVHFKSTTFFHYENLMLVRCSNSKEKTQFSIEEFCHSLMKNWFFL